LGAVGGGGVTFTNTKPAWIITGPGNCGATLMVRWLIERGTEDRLKDMVLAQVPYFRQIVTYRSDGFPTRLRHRLRGSDDVRFLQDFLQNIAPGEKASLLDLNDWPLWESPELIELTKGVENLVSCQIITPGPIGALVMERLRDAGFKPAKTVLVLNDTVGQWCGVPPRGLDTFEDIIRSPAFLRAVDDGAVVVTMPRMDAATSDAMDSDARVVRMRQALAGGIDDHLVAHLKEWLRAMDRAFKPVQNWLP
jgi:hypothetical protein